ncbi:MAG: dihydrolipoyllysine-residue acetyltransferase [Proteobacteria bacterium]|nr:dihydrolipoyllysine-residue acetyltransferase [Pseudomonadota bacterium]
MSNQHEIRVPDIGSTTAVDVIEILVKPGDHVEKDTSLITLEGEKATMEVPSPRAGIIQSLSVKVGDKVSEGDLILILTDESNATSSEEKASVKPEKSAEPTIELKPVLVPDIGNAPEVDVIEVLVKPGDHIEKDSSLITLEGEKATMEVPSPYVGEVKEVHVKVGDKVSQNTLIVTMAVSSSGQSESSKPSPSVPAASVSRVEAFPPPVPGGRAREGGISTSLPNQAAAYAGPAVRRFARELGVDLTQVKGSGRKNRIVKEDIQSYVKAKLSGMQQSGGIAVAPMPAIDFSLFGTITTQPLNKIKKLTARNVHRSWVSIPHVTQFDEVDITAMEEYRKEKKGEAEAQGFKLTPLVFIMRAVVASLKQFPAFNASLDPSGENLILKQYYHIGVAVDTPNGLVVPVIRDVDKKTVFDLAKELGEISQRAKTKGLTPKEMQGGCFTISSLGGIGGTAFTPIVNQPEVAILGVSRSSMKPVYAEGKFVPRLMLPLSLSYDHRVIDGADGARFITHLSSCLSDIKTLL